MELIPVNGQISILDAKQKAHISFRNLNYEFHTVEFSSKNEDSGIRLHLTFTKEWEWNQFFEFIKKHIHEISYEYTINGGKYHRIDGPAKIYLNGDKEWWLDGYYY